MNSQDTDLLHPDAELAAAVADLRRAADIGGLGPLTFAVSEPTSAALDRFPLDLDGE